MIVFSCNCYMGHEDVEKMRDELERQMKTGVVVLPVQCRFEYADGLGDEKMTVIEKDRVTVIQPNTGTRGRSLSYVLNQTEEAK